MAPRKTTKQNPGNEPFTLSDAEKNNLIAFINRVEASVEADSGYFPYTPYEEAVEAYLAQLAAIQEHEQQMANQRARRDAQRSKVTPLPTGFNDFRDEA